MHEKISNASDNIDCIRKYRLHGINGLKGIFEEKMNIGVTSPKRGFLNFSLKQIHLWDMNIHISGLFYFMF